MLLPLRLWPARPALVAFIVALAVASWPSDASAQLGALASPGPLAKAHAGFEGLDNCQKCHEPGRQVTATKCLSCHQPIAIRIGRKKGVHRDVSNDCVACHVEHAGVDADLRPLDTRGFNHAVETGFALDGQHAKVATNCAACHKTRSFLAVKPECASCHKDPHQGKLTATCTTCHSTAAAFKDAAKTFDHAKSAFPLTGKHQALQCSQCHKTKAFKDVAFASCASCHKTPHPAKFSTDCATCHQTAAWQTKKVDHARTSFPLTGAHQKIDCAKCHAKSPVQVKLKSNLCTDCHTDPHKGQFKAQGCQACHDTASFKTTKGFDHTAQTGFALTGKHGGVECAKCHKSAAPSTLPLAKRIVDFKGASKACASCHSDPHRGELGTTCESCHSTSTFTVSTFTHPNQPEFYAGSHANLACLKCHAGTKQTAPTAPARTGALVAGAKFKGISTTCVSCHADVHLGQVSTTCETCHAIDAAKFAAVRFSHDRAAYPLTGKHRDVECAKCHKVERASFPAGMGEARRLTGIPKDCVSCHTDVHLGQITAKCDTCHTPASFKVEKFTHKGLEHLFVGAHATLECVRCHAKAEGVFPAGRGIAVKFRTGTECSSCHRDPHQNAMGPSCASCHSPDTWRSPSTAFHKLTTFPLEGQHVAVPCQSCHVKGQVKGTPTTCYTCHWVRRQDDRYTLQLGAQCEECHRPAAWTAVRFDHGARTGTALNASHQSLACASCHKSQTFANARPECISCHEPDYKATKSPAHAAAGFPVDCTVCHAPSAVTFAGARFAHDTFQLVGQHATQSCATCHKGNVYKGTPRECVGCHQADYQRTTSPAHAAAGFPTTCDSCHRATDASWKGATFSHSQFYPLSGSHATAACATCHKSNVYKGLSRECASCHQADYQRAATPNHVAAAFPTACETCHKATGPGWQGASFNHAPYWALNGSHGQTACASCHKNGQYKGTSTDCFACHQPDYQRAASPNHVATSMPTTCENCHKNGGPGWRGANFSHTQYYALNGAHATASCASCHKNNQYAGTPRDCVSCHQPDYQRAANPNHVAASLPTTCDNCHRGGGPGWGSGNFSHTQYYPLSGLHATTSCINCHKTGQYKGTPKDCASCHQAEYQATKAPNHAAAGFTTTCEACHKSGGPGWAGASINHSQYYPLLAKHSTANCASCHVNNVFKGTPRTCVPCHQADYQRPTNPNHVTAGFPTTCEGCHKEGGPGWSGASFNHSQYYALSGVHATTACATCHKNNVYKGTSRDCVGCHQAQYQATSKPNHAAAGFSTACESCHRNGGPGWTGASINHTQYYPLLAKHSTANCASCHVNNVFKGTPRTCVPCHQADYQRPTNPNHVAAGFPTICENCHKEGGPGWTSTFNHSTTWALSGMHATTACASCHKNNVYKGTTRDCAGCHLPQYQATTKPNHAAAGFTTACDACHRNGGPGWLGASINHTQYYPLLGKHSTANCASCHVNNVYKGTPRTCVPCHQADYTRPTSPNHVTAGFPTTCEGCHKEGGPGWTPSTFNHAQYFALQGAHTTLTCNRCHATNVYRGTPRTCVGCHQAKYDATRSPNHRAASFPTTCDTCHRATDTLWTQGRFDHTWFPITSGKHSGRACSDCHQDPNNYKSFTCLTCHTRSETDKEHQGRNGYRYDSAACLSCHPNGRS